MTTSDAVGPAETLLRDVLEGTHPLTHTYERARQVDARLRAAEEREQRYRAALERIIGTQKSEWGSREMVQIARTTLDAGRDDVDE